MNLDKFFAVAMLVQGVAIAGYDFSQEGYRLPQLVVVVGAIIFASLIWWLGKESKPGS